jgi:hypothetical protein
MGDNNKTIMAAITDSYLPKFQGIITEENNLYTYTPTKFEIIAILYLINLGTYYKVTLISEKFGIEQRY